MSYKNPNSISFYDYPRTDSVYPDTGPGLHDTWNPNVLPGWPPAYNPYPATKIVPGTLIQDTYLEQIKQLEKLMDKAEKLTDGMKKEKDTHDLITERASTHGDFELNTDFMQSVKGKMRVIKGSKYSGLDAYQKEALDMIVHKIGRILFGDPTTVDHWDDIAGYAKLVSSILTKNQRTEAVRPPRAPTTTSPLPPQPTASKPVYDLLTASVTSAPNTVMTNGYNEPYTMDEGTRAVSSNPAYAENMAEAMKMSENKVVRKKGRLYEGVVYNDLKLGVGEYNG